MADFLASDRGREAGVDFTEQEVHVAFTRLRQCAASIDGMSKMWLKPLERELLPLVTALFSYVYRHGLSVESWALAVVV